VKLKYRVFISHSAKGDPAAFAFVEKLAARLRKAGYEVLVDLDLTVGDGWEHMIGWWVDRCHASIVVFTRKALKSDYVKFEVGNLLHRWHSAGGPAGTFHLFPLLTEPLAEADLKGFYSSINLWALQRFNYDKNPEASIKAVLAKLKTVSRKFGAFDSTLETNLTSILENLKDDQLTATAVKVGLNTKQWPAAKVTPYFVSALISSSMATAWEVVKELRVPLGAARTRDLFDLLMPCWVGAECGRALQRVTKAGAGPRCALIDAEAVSFTPKMYLVRASGRLPAMSGLVVPVVASDLGTNFEEGLRSKVRKLLEDQLNVNAPFREFPTSVAEQLEMKSRSNEPVIVALRLDATLLPKLKKVAETKDFEHATFVALTRPAPPDADAPGVSILRPLLPKDLEKRAYQLYHQYDDTLGKT
jgi:hypothetical protein